jgi:hypothetical protein
MLYVNFKLDTQFPFSTHKTDKQNYSSLFNMMSIVLNVYRISYIVE